MDQHRQRTARLAAGRSKILWAAGLVLSPLAVAMLVLAASAPVPTLARVAADRGASTSPPLVTLRLQPGLHFPGSIPIKPAPDIPPGDVNIQVPLYPEARPAEGIYARPGFTVQISPYLKSAWAMYRLPVSPSMAMIWYRGQFASNAYTLGPSAQGGQGENTVAELSFISRGNPNLSVQVSFQGVAGDATVITYFAQDVVVPSSQAMHLSGPFSEVHISYRPFQQLGGPPQATTVSTLTAASVIAALVSQINALAPAVSRTAGCEGDLNAGATLVFVRANGSTVSVEDRPACFRVTVSGNAPLSDTNQAVWGLVSRLVQPAQA